MLFALETGWAVLAHAGVAQKVERTERGGPECGALLAQPALDIGERFGFRWHVVCIPMRMRISRFLARRRGPAECRAVVNGLSIRARLPQP